MEDNEEKLSTPLPRDAKIINGLLKSMGVEECEPHVIQISRAMVSANFSFSQPLPREVFLELAKNRNKTPTAKLN
ncbi:hypothetical protein KIW84_071068 [Lathyrus oleraceus]|uniref:Uncharacterized protein n=1 Tax=Pisum sativum TaxID=3888 RepID=A0A9D4VIJ2_PEA|nr:hypothetical protein KIW84_071068 [Pisum sativum]